MHRDEAYAEVAASRTNGELPRVPGDSEQSLNDLPDLSLIADGAAFAHAVSAHENLPGVFVKLLRSEDEKIKQRAAERLVEMKFGKGSAPPDEPPQIILDAPRPERD